MPPWLSYVLLTFAASAPFYIALRRLPPPTEESNPLDRAVRQLMWVPGLVALGFIAFNRSGFDTSVLGMGDRPWLLLAAFFLPLVMEFLLIFLSIRLKLGSLDSSLYNARGGWITFSPSIRLVLGHTKQTYFKFAVNIAATVGVAAAFSLIFSFAEELGWRGYLQGLLIDRFDLAWGVFLGGLLWGLWYAPLVLKGFRFPGYPKLGAFLFMPLFTVSAGIVTGWLFWISGSLWAAAIFNAALKVTAPISEAALGDAGASRRVRIVWLWLWALLAGLVLTLWYASL